MRTRVAVVAAVVLAALLLIRACGDEGVPSGVQTVPSTRDARDAEPFPDPFAWDPDRGDELVRRAARGLAHGLYAFSPGGIEESAERTARWRGRIEATAKAARVDPDRLEGLILLESAGREDAITAAGTEGAVGLVQIVSGTATDLLGMKVDLARSRHYTRRIERELRRANLLKVQALRQARRRVDDRFDPARALAGAARYLTLARERFGREDLAFVSYHMGMGNLEGVLDAFGSRDASWAEIYFDTTPLRHRAAYERLNGFADDSQNYLWKIEAAMEIMRLYREDRDELRRRAALQTSKASAEELLHPPGSTPRFADAVALEQAWDAGDIVAFPDDPQRTALRRDRRMGELSRRLGVPGGLYRGLRPEALALALYMGAHTRAFAGGDDTTLTVTSTVRDDRYQALLVRRNREATRRYSLHTTGWAFDVLRDYRDRRHALAFQFVLERLRALDLIAWVREPAAIHVTVSSDAKALLGLLDRLKSG